MNPSTSVSYEPLILSPIYSPEFFASKSNFLFVFLQLVPSIKT